MNAATFRPVANVDGTVTAIEDARIPVLDRGFLYGDSVYEVFRTYNGVPLFYEEHLDRLENSARLIQMPLSQSRDELTEQIRETVVASRAVPGDEVYVRYHVTRGVGPMELYARPTLQTSFVILVKEVPPWKPEFWTKGVRLAVTHVQRNPVAALDPNIKSGNYLNNILAVNEAIDAGADDCLMLNHEGLVTESSNSNVFFVLDGKLVTPSTGNLRGITRTAISAACEAHGLSVHETEIGGDELSSAAECFLSSATREVMPVRSIKLDGGGLLELPEGGGPLTKRVADLYRQYLNDYVRDHEHLRLVPASAGAAEH